MKLSSTITLVTMIISIVSPSVASMDDNSGNRQVAVATEEEPIQALEVASGVFEKDTLNDFQQEDESNKIDTISSRSEEGEAGRKLTYVNFYGYYGYACRTSHGDQGYEGYDYHRYHNVYDINWCKQKCTDDYNCYGYEYSEYDYHCEIWYTYIHQYEEKSGFSCFYKEGY